MEGNSDGASGLAQSSGRAKQHGFVFKRPRQWNDQIGGSIAKFISEPFSARHDVAKSL
jgi:hypothetical protein